MEQSQYIWVGRRKPLTPEEIHNLTHFDFVEIIPQDFSDFDDLIPLEKQKPQPVANQQKKKKKKQKKAPPQEPNSHTLSKCYEPQSPTNKNHQPFISTPIKKPIPKYKSVPQFSQEIPNTPVFGNFVPAKKEIPKNDNFMVQDEINNQNFLKKQEKPIIKQNPKNDSLMVKSQGNPSSRLKQQGQPSQGIVHSTNVKKNPHHQQNVENCEVNDNQKNLQLSFSRHDILALQSRHQEKKTKEENKREEENKKRKQEERIKREEEDKKRKQEERIKREQEDKKRRKEQEQRERRRKSIINEEQVRMELQSRRIRQEEERKKQEIDKMESQIEKDKKMRKKLHELKQTKVESAQKSINALKQQLEKQLSKTKNDITIQESQRTQSRLSTLWEQKITNEQKDKEFYRILEDKTTSIENRIKTEKSNLEKELAFLSKQQLKKAEEKYLKQLKDMYRTLALNKLKQKNYQDSIYIDDAILRLVNETHSKELAILLNEIRTKQTQFLNMIRSSESQSINHYETLKTQLIDNYLAHPVLRLQKQQFHQSMIKLRPPKELRQIDRLWILRKETVKKITSITQCLIGDLQFQIDKINKKKLFPNANIPEIQKQELWNKRQQELKKLYQQKHTLQDYNINFYNTSFFRARQILQQAYTLCLEKQNNRNELFLLRELMNGAEIERKLDFYERSEMMEKMNESVQQIEYLKSELQRKNQTLKQIDQVYKNDQNYHVVQIIEKGKQDDQEVKKICQRKIQAYKQFVNDYRKRDEVRKKMYSQGKVWKQEEIKKHREIMERVKRDFLDNDTTFINVYNRDKHSSARAQPNAYKDYQRLPSSAPRPCKQQLRKQPQLKQVSILEPVDEVPIPKNFVPIPQPVPEPLLPIRRQNIMPINQPNPANPQPPQAIDSRVDYGGMILKEIPELKDLEQIMRNRCIDSQELDQKIHVHLFEFRMMLAQTYLAVCLQKHPHEITQRIDSLVQRDQEIVDFFISSNVYVPQESTNYIRSFANGFKQTFQIGVKTSIRLLPFEIYPQDGQNPFPIPAAC